MLTRAALRKGWCPGALSPMRAKDGLLVRLRITGGALSADTLAAIAQCSRACGNGLIDLSARANLQLRGVFDEKLPLLQSRLEALCLIDANPRAEAVRNVMTSPLAGLAAPIDIRPIGAALERALVNARDLHSLPGKFGFLIDDSGPLTLAHEPADIGFFWQTADAAFAVTAGGGASSTCLGLCAPAEVVDAALALARAFLALRGAHAEKPRRMSELISLPGAEALAGVVELRPGVRRIGAPGVAKPVGAFAAAEIPCFGAAAAFGRLTCEMLDAAAETARRCASGEIRLTPWRTLLLPGVRDAETAQNLLAAAGFIVDADDPALSVAACGGVSACAEATTTTHAHALALAPLARRIGGAGIGLHVSGCVKGCSCPRAAPITLVGSGGLYDLILDGAPFAAPFARNLSFAAARDILERMSHKGGESEKKQ